MLRAKAYIEALTDEARREGKNGAVMKYTRCLNSLRDFAGDALDALTLLQVQTAEWREAFRRQLQSGEGARAAATLDERLATLRGVCRKAIKAGLLPNVSPSGGVEIAGLKPFGRSEDMLSVLAAYARGSRLAAARTEQSMALGYAALSVLLAGMGLAGMARLRRSDYDATAQTLRLPHLGVTVCLPESVQLLLDDLCDASAAPQDALFPRLAPFIDADKPSAEADKPSAEAQRLTARVQQALQSLDLQFAQGFSEPFVHWIELARERAAAGCPDLGVVLERRGDEAQRIRAVERLMAVAAKDYGHLTRCWYGVKCVGTSGQKLMRSLLDDDGVALTEEAFYAPYDEVVQERNGKKRRFNSPAVDRLLFFRSNQPQAATVQRVMRTRGNIYGTTEGGRKRYSPIPAHEIDNLRRFLAVAGGRRLPLTPDMEHYGKRVRVVTGLYEGCEGVIEDPHPGRRHEGSGVSPVFCVRIMGKVVVATPDIDREYLVEI